MLGFSPVGSAPLGVSGEAVANGATGVAAWVEGSEIFAMTATVAEPTVSAAAAWMEGSEAFAMTASVAVPVVAAWVEESEIFAMVGILGNEGNENMSFTPSTARTVTIGAGSKPFTAGELWMMSDPKRPRAPKDPDATIDFSFNWSPWLADVADTISTHQILTTEGLVDEGSTFVGDLVTVFLSAGTLSKRAEVTCRIVTKSVPPRIEDRTIYLDIESR